MSVAGPPRPRAEGRRGFGPGRSPRARFSRSPGGRVSRALLQSARRVDSICLPWLSARAHVDDPPKDETSKPCPASVAADDRRSEAGGVAAVGRAPAGVPVVLAKKRATAASDVIHRRPTRIDSSRTRWPSGPGNPLVTHRQAACRASGFPDRDSGRNAGSDRTGTRRSARSVAASASWLLMTRRCRRADPPDLSRLGSDYVVPTFPLALRSSTLQCRIWCDAKGRRARARSIPRPSSRT